MDQEVGGLNPLSVTLKLRQLHVKIVAAFFIGPESPLFRVSGFHLINIR